MTKRDLRNLAGKTGTERRAALAEIRRRAVRLVVKGGRKPSGVAKLFDVTPQTMSKWLADYRRSGDKGLQPRKTTGRPPALTKDELGKLKRTIVGKNPNQLNFGVLLWSLPIIVALIKQLFGKELHSTTVSRYLADLGLTPQVPRRRSYRRDEREIRRWMAEEFPRIVGDVRRKQAVLLFLDEAGVHENAPIGRTWGRKGHRPIVSASGNRTKVNVISAVTPSGRLWFRCYKGNLDSPTFIGFLQALLHDVRGDIVLVMDSHPSHVSEETMEWLEARMDRLQAELLPAYAPELNPDEHVWGLLKGMFRRNPLKEGQALADVVGAAMIKLKDQRALIRALFGHPDLEYMAEHLDTLS
jgi:transposase